jgi:cullin-associated NEDD8-dissociated protein 1
MAIRSVIANVKATPTVAHILAESLLPNLYAPDFEHSLDSMDIVTDLIKRFGSSISSREVDRLASALLQLISSGKGIVRKRAVAAVALLSRYLSATSWTNLTQFVESGVKSTDLNEQKALIQLTGNLAKLEPSRFKQILPNVIPDIIDSFQLDTLGDEDEPLDQLEVRETALAALEAFNGLGYSTVEPYVPEMLDICAEFIRFNPNYIQDDGSDDEMEDNINDVDDYQPMEGDDEFDDASEFDDSDDQSWKLRRYAAKLAASLVQVAPRQLPAIYAKLLQSLVSMLSSEQEETVKVELIAALCMFIGAASDDGIFYGSRTAGRRSSDTSMQLETDPQTQLLEYLPRLVKISLKELCRSSSVPTMQGYLGVFGSLIRVLQGIKSQLPSVVSVLASLSQSKPPLLIDILDLVAVILRHHEVQELNPLLLQLTDIIALGINDSYYKISGEALDVALDLFALYTSGGQSLNIPVSVVQSGIVARATSNNLDLETREKAVKALGQLVAYAPLSQSDFDSGCLIVLDLLSNESLRGTSLSATAVIARSSRELSANWIVAVVDRLSGFLNQSSRSLRQDALNAIRAITSQSGWHTMSDANLVASMTTVSRIVLGHGQEVLTSSDGHAIQVVVHILTDLVPVADNSVVEFAIGVINQLGVEVARDVSDSVLALFRAIVQNSDKRQIHSVYSHLSKPSSNNAELAARALAVVITEGQLNDKIPDYESAVCKYDAPNLRWSLLVMGNVGKLLPLGMNLDPLYMQLTTQTDESTKVSVAQTIGQIASNNLDRYLDPLLSRLQAAEHCLYLYLVVVREVVDNAKAHLEKIWFALFSLDLNKDSFTEGVHSLLAEILGKLSILNPEGFLPQLQVHLSSEKASVRATVLSAVKYTFGQPHDRYDDLLRPIIADFLALVEDEDIGIRQLALSALGSAIRNKPHLLIPHLARLLPLLYKETVVNQSLIRSVQMGPFKHKVDDGLDLRKTAYETIYELVNTLSRERLQAFGMLDEMLDRILAGLSDEQDIKVYSCVILGRLVSVDLSVLTASGKLDQVITTFGGLLNATVKESAIKQEFEKQGEIDRNISKTSQQIDEVIKNALDKGETTGLSDVELANWSRYFTNMVSAKQS